MTQTKKTTTTKTAKKNTGAKTCGCKKTCTKTANKKCAKKQDEFNVYLVTAMSIAIGGLLVANTIMLAS